MTTRLPVLITVGFILALGATDVSAQQNPGTLQMPAQRQQQEQGGMMGPGIGHGKMAKE